MSSPGAEQSAASPGPGQDVDTSPVTKIMRGHKKGAVTRSMNSLERYVVEEDVSAVNDTIQTLMTTFKVFEGVCERYRASLTESSEIDESDEYFAKAQSEYIRSLRNAKDWVKGYTRLQPSTPAAPQVPVSADLHGLMNLPKIEIDHFDGNPLSFHSFMATFNEVVDRIAVDDKVKLTRLLQYTTGKAKDAIRSCILLEGGEGYQRALRILRERYGNDFVITERMINGIRQGKSVKSAEDLTKLADELANCEATLLQMNRLSEVDSQLYVLEVVKRLEPYIQRRWKARALDYKQEKGRYPGFAELVKFVAKEAADASDPVYGKIGQYQNQDKKRREPSAQQQKTTSFTSTTEQAPPRRQISPCLVCSGEHKLLFCGKFKEMKLTDRVKFVKDKKLCENCLLDNHETAKCRKPTVCTVEGCGQKHTRLIHVNKPGGKPVSSQGATVSEGENVVQANTSLVSKKGVNLPVVPVSVNSRISTGALLDSGSTASFCSKRLVEQLQLKGLSSSLALSTLNGKSEQKTELVDLNLVSEDGSKSLWLKNVMAVEQIPVQTGPINVDSYPHLSDLPLHQGQGVDVLIGQDNAEALLPLEVRKGERGEPFAVKTLLGWSVNGPGRVLDSFPTSSVSNFVSVETLDRKVDALWDIENERILNEKCPMSSNDRKVLSLWDGNCKMVDGHFELPIPWKPDVELPNNVAMARSRLKSLQVSLVKRGLEDRYNEEINKLFVNGYAELVPEAEISKESGVWYVPHHAVISDKKPDKVRIVYDCAAQFQGESLNDKCLQGPDMNNMLIHVLLRFRQYRYAIMSDVEAMYYQVLVPITDRDALRFLWVNEDGSVKHCRMTRHLFGGVWCSSIATYALRKSCGLVEDCDPLASEIVHKSFYVDDCLISVASPEDVMRVVQGTKSVLKEGGFNLTKFVINDQELLSRVPPDDRAKEVKELCIEANSKALGVKWCVTQDHFYFDVDFVNQIKVTRRSILSIVSSTFDPLGLLSPIIVVGRLLFQEATRLKLGWDEIVPDQLRSKWVSWLYDLNSVTDIKIPRCVTFGKDDETKIEVHHFSDASSKAYGCCSYLRSVAESGEAKVSLLISKAKVAPLKTITLPRLELQAAVMSAQVDAMLRQELDLQICNSHFWVDSEIVLKYILNENRRFHVFVANRIGLIRELTNPSQWHHIAGKDNPADVVSRGINPKDLDVDQWCNGPEFLRKEEIHFESTITGPMLLDNDPEVKSDRECFVVSQGDEHPIDTLSKHYSSWYRLKRAVAWWMKLIRRLRNKDQGSSPLSVDEIQEAEMVVVKHVQRGSFSSEIQRLGEGRKVSKKSEIKALDPLLDSNGMLVVGGRIRRSQFHEQVKHPYLIPSDHSVAQLIVSEVHQVAHLGCEWIVSQVRKRYWIIGLRRIVKAVSKRCVECKKLFAEPCLQKMADLPAERLEPNNPPFYYTGVDCFGPFGIKQGRSEVKRYGCIFTCLTTRAIHMEKLNSLDTNSFINAFRRFVSRRGVPSKIWSDNGTNFVGANTELRKSFEEIDQEQVRKCALKLQVEWSFNPPYASHMGGIWERLIRTVRKVMSGLQNMGSRLSDEMFETLLCEVESIVNGRPITKVSDDVNDLECLTPNHLLMLQGQASVSIGRFADVDLYKRKWRCVQYLAQQYWTRWIREYIPELQKRQKWLKVQRNVKPGDVVLVVAENTPRGIWPMGRVIQTKQGADGLVREAKVKTKSTVLTRPVTKLVFLEGSEE